MSDTSELGLQVTTWREWLAVALLRLFFAATVSFPFLLVEAWFGGSEMRWRDKVVLIAMGAAVAKVDTWIRQASE